eukprot:12287029-Ditylum_brightwellii.AAC.1
MERSPDAIHKLVTTCQTEKKMKDMIENLGNYTSLETVPAIEDAFEEYNLEGFKSTIFCGDGVLDGPEVIVSILEDFSEADDDNSDLFSTDNF